MLYSTSPTRIDVSANAHTQAVHGHQGCCLPASVVMQLVGQADLEQVRGGNAKHAVRRLRERVRKHLRGACTRWVTHRPWTLCQQLAE